MTSDGFCHYPDLSKCDPAMIFVNACVQTGAPPKGWAIVDNQGRGITLWNGIDGAGSLVWTLPHQETALDFVRCVPPLLSITFARNDQLVVDLKAELAAGIADSLRILPAGTKQIRTGKMTAGPWSGLFATYACLGGKTTVTLFVAGNGSPHTMIDVMIQSQAGNTKAITDFAGTFRLEAGNIGNQP
jgi:hypothetical protein